jgi:hypothetical protein
MLSPAVGRAVAEAAIGIQGQLVILIETQTGALSQPLAGRAHLHPQAVQSARLGRGLLA